MPDSQYPAFYAGQVLTASQIQALAPLEAWKTTATSRTTTTVSIDPDLQLALAANATYDVEASIIYQGAGGFNFGWTIPSGASGGYTAAFSLSGSAVGIYGYAWGTGVIAATGTGTVFGILLKGTLITGTTAGTFGLNWADDTTSDTAQTGAGSILKARRIA
jgi:hypothetical protein